METSGEIAQVIQTKHNKITKIMLSDDSAHQSQEITVR